LARGRSQNADASTAGVFETSSRRLHQLDGNYTYVRMDRQATNRIVDAPDQSRSWTSAREVELAPLTPIGSHKYEQKTPREADPVKSADLMSAIGQPRKFADL